MNKYLKVGLKIMGYISAFAAITAGIAFIAERIEEVRSKGAELIHKPYGIYERYIKRPLDCFLSTGALIVLSPVMFVSAVVVALDIKGNPFFVQERPGRYEKVFKLIKLKSMNDNKDENGELLPDSKRITSIGRFVRKTSLDELWSLINIIKGNLAVIGPRPLLVKYLPLYNEEQRHRHDVRPGLTGLAQANGRNAISWEQKFAYDTEYVKKITFKGDLLILLKTVVTTLKHDGISQEGQATMEEFKGYEERVVKV